MLLKRFAWIAGVLLLGISLASVAQARKFSLVGGGAESHIGTGLALPVQPSVTPGIGTGTVFPPLLVPAKTGQVINGTTARPLQTVTGKQAYQRRLNIPTHVLSKPAGQTTVGLHFSNPVVFAVGTNLEFQWPSQGVKFDIKPGFQTTTVIGPGSSQMIYSNALGQRFGGPAGFNVNAGPSDGIIPTWPVTVYIKVNGATPPCVHSALGGPVQTNPALACVAGLLAADPAATGAIGATNNISVTTPGAAIAGPNVAILDMGLTPSGTINLAVAAATNTAIPPTNMATSIAGSWTTGQVVISNGDASGTAEIFTLSGKDSRTANGGGTIQLVSGSVSARTVSGPNANRGWLRLELSPVEGTPALSPLAQAAAAGMVLLAGGYIARRKLS